MIHGFRTRLIAYEANGNRLGQLPCPISWNATTPRNDVSALTVTYSRRAIGGQLLDRPLSAGLEIGVEWSWPGMDWAEPRNGRFVVPRRSWRHEDETETITLTCPGYGWLLGKIRNLNPAFILSDGQWQSGTRPFYNQGANGVLRQLLVDQFIAPDHDIQFVFTDNTMSSGATEALRFDHFVPYGESVLETLVKLTERGACDWHFQGRELVLRNVDEGAVDRSATTVLHMGVDVIESPSDETMEDVAGLLVLRGGEGKSWSKTTAAPSPWGRWHEMITDDRVTDTTTANQVLDTAAKSIERVTGQFIRDLAPTAKALPFVAFEVGDWVSVPGSGRPEKMRLEMVTLRYDGDSGLTPSTTWNDRLLDDAIRRQRRLAITEKRVDEAATKTAIVAPDTELTYTRADGSEWLSIGPDGVVHTDPTGATTTIADPDEVSTGGSAPAPGTPSALVARSQFLYHSGAPITKLYGGSYSYLKPYAGVEFVYHEGHSYRFQVNGPVNHELLHGNGLAEISVNWKLYSGLKVAGQGVTAFLNASTTQSTALQEVKFQGLSNVPDVGEYRSESTTVDFLHLANLYGVTEGQTVRVVLCLDLASTRSLGNGATSFDSIGVTQNSVGEFWVIDYGLTSGLTALTNLTY